MSSTRSSLLAWKQSELCQTGRFSFLYSQGSHVCSSANKSGKSMSHPHWGRHQARTCFSEKYLADSLQEANCNWHEKVKIQRPHCSQWEFFVSVSLCFLMVWDITGAHVLNTDAILSSAFYVCLFACLPARFILLFGGCPATLF